MGSLTGELQRREAAARREADDLRGELAQLNERLAQAGERLARQVAGSSLPSASQRGLAWTMSPGLRSDRRYVSSAVSGQGTPLASRFE